LIHEATFDDSLLENAISHNHSTIREAAEIATMANSKYLILTHFS